MTEKRKPDFPFKVCGLGESGSKQQSQDNPSAANVQEFPEKIVLSCVTKDKGLLTKIMRKIQKPRNWSRTAANVQWLLDSSIG